MKKPKHITGAAKRDAGAAKRDAEAAKRDTGAAKRVAGAAKRDAGVAKRDTGAAKRDAGVAKRDAGAAKRDAGVAKRVTGSARSRIDDKGRISLPARCRDLFDADAEAVITLNPYESLSLYAPPVFARLCDQITAIGNVGFADAHLEEMIIGCAETVTLDSAGRLLISSHLRQRAKINRAVLLFAVGDSVRIWDEEQWEKRHVWVASQLQEQGLSEPWKKVRI